MWVRNRIACRGAGAGEVMVGDLLRWRGRGRASGAGRDPSLGEGERLVHDLVHVEVLVGAAASDEEERVVGIRQRLVAAVALVVAAVGRLDRIVSLQVVL